MVDVTLWFALGTVGMALGTAVLLYGLRFVPGTERRDYAILIAVPGIAFVAYGLMALGMGGVRSAVGGIVFLPRYVDWLLTTPLHILFLGLIAGASRGLMTRAAGLQAATIVLGMIGAFVGSPLKWVFYVAGSLAFGMVVYYAYRGFDDAARARSGTRFSLFRKLRAFLVVLWLVYPVIWLVGPNAIQLMDVETTALVVSYIDIVAKVGFGLIALDGYHTTAGTETESSAAVPSD